MTVRGCEVNPQKNPYTGEPMQSSFSYAVACYEPHKKEMSKEFASRDEAEKFLNACDSDPFYSPWKVSCQDKEVEEIHQ